MDGPHTVGGLIFSTTGTGSYIITGTDTLTMDNGALAARVNVNGGSHTIATPVALASNLAVSVTGGSVLTISGAISETNSGTSLTLDGGGQMILSGNNSYTGLTTVNGGTLQIGDGVNGSVGATSGYVTNGVLAFNLPTATVSQPISGSGSLVQMGGVLNLTAANSYHGSTVINAGTLKVATATAYSPIPTPLAHYTMDGAGGINGGDPVPNSGSGAGIDGIMVGSGASYASGKIGQAIQFPGGSGVYVNVPHSSAFDNSRTLAFRPGFTCRPTAAAPSSRPRRRRSWDGSVPQVERGRQQPRIEYGNPRCRAKLVWE